MMLLASAAPAVAQESAAPPPQAKTDEDRDVIIVTATRREADVTDLPLSITAIQGDDLVKNAQDDLADAVTNGPDAIIMRAGTIRAYRALLRAAGGVEPAMIEMPNFGYPVLSHNGIPVLRNDYLANNETLGSGTNLCSVYAVRMNEADGLHGLFGGASAGIRVENIGTVQNKDANRIRLKWYCGLALKSTKSLARLRGVTNI